MKQNLAIAPSGNISLQQQSKKISIQSNQAVSEAFYNKNYQLQDRYQQEPSQMQDLKIRMQEQQKQQRWDKLQKKNQDQLSSIQMIQTVKTEEFDDDEPVQINLYSQKNFSLDRQKGDSIQNTQNGYEPNRSVINNFDKKNNSQSIASFQKQVTIEKTPQNKVNSVQIGQGDNKTVPNNLVKTSSPKEGLRYSKSYQNIQGGSSKHRTGNVSNEIYSSKQDNFSSSLQSQNINNPSSLIDHYKLKYLQEVEKSLSSNNTNSLQASDDILTQKMQLIEQKKKKIVQQANNDGKNLKIPLISQTLEFNNRYPTIKKNQRLQPAYKKRMSLREQTKRKKQLTDKKSVRLNKSMKASRLSTSFDLYCIYESKSEDSNDHSPQESRNRSFFFKSEKILNQFGVPSAPSSPTAEKDDEILDSSEINEDRVINTVPNSSRQDQMEKNVQLAIQNQNLIQKNSNKKDENTKIVTQESDNSNILDCSIAKTPMSNDSKNQQQKGIEEISMKNSDSNAKLKKSQTSNNKNVDFQRSKVHKSNSTIKKNLEQTSNNTNKLTTSNQNQLTLISSTAQNRQNSQNERKENLRSSQLTLKNEQNMKLNQEQAKEKGNQMTSSTMLPKKEQPQQQLIIYDLKNHKTTNPEKQIFQQPKIKDKVENTENPQNDSTIKPKLEQDQSNENEQTNKDNISCSSEVEENIDGSPKGLNIINLYRKSNSQQDVPNHLDNQKQEELLNPQLVSNASNNSNSQNQYPFKKRNSSLSSFTSPQNSNTNNNKFDNSNNLRNSMPKMPQVLPLTASQLHPQSKSKDFRFMTEEGTPQQSQNNNGSNQNQNQTDSFMLQITQSAYLNKDQQNMKKEQKDYTAQIRDMYQSDRIQVITFDKKQQRNKNQDDSKNTSLKGRRNSLNQLQGQKLITQSNQTTNNNYPLNTLVNQSNVYQGFKKSESQAAFQNSTYREQFKQKLELKSINMNQGYNLSLYIQNNMRQLVNQSSQSPKGNRKGGENMDSVGESQCNSPKEARSEKLRQNISYSSINKSKANSDLNSPEVKSNNQKMLDSKKLKVIKVHPKTNQQSPTYKPQKLVTQQYNPELEVLDFKSNINDMYYKKSIKPSPSRNQNLWSPESQGKQISQLDTQVSHLQSTKTNPDTDNSNIIDNSKQKKNVQVSEFYKDLSSPLFVQLGNGHAQVSLPSNITQSAKNDRYKNIKDEIEKISSTNTSALRREQVQLQNSQVMSPFWGQIDLKKSDKKELVIKPLIQESSQQKQQQKKNKFNVESKVKSYIQAGQLNQIPLNKQKDSSNFHLAKGVSIQNSGQQLSQMNSKSLHQESLDLGKQNKEKQSQSMFTTYDSFGQVNGNSTPQENNFIVNNNEQSEKSADYQLYSKQNNTKSEVKQNITGPQNQQVESQNKQQPQLSSVEYLTQIQQQMQMQRQLANEQLQKAQQSINLIQQSIEIKSTNGSNYNTLLINGKQNYNLSQK